MFKGEQIIGKFLLLLFAFVFCCKNWATTYYIDYNGGKDSNNGKSPTSPWKLCPGMTGFAGAYSHTPGDSFIFKGGVTWTNICLPLNVSYNGTSTLRDFYGTVVSKRFGIGPAVFDRNFIALTGIEMHSISFVSLSGFRILNGLTAAEYGSMSFFIEGSCHSVIVDNLSTFGGDGNAVHIKGGTANNTMTNITIQNSDLIGHADRDAILVRPGIDTLLIKNNLIHHILNAPDDSSNDGIHIENAMWVNTPGIQRHIIVEGNDFYNNAGTKSHMLIHDADHIIIRYNRFHGTTGGGHAITIASSSGAGFPGDGIQIYYNLFYNLMPQTYLPDLSRKNTFGYVWHQSKYNNEYYLTLTNNANPHCFYNIYNFFIDNCSVWEDSSVGFNYNGTLGFLKSNQWGFGDNDSIGFNTLYIKCLNGNPATNEHLYQCFTYVTWGGMIRAQNTDTGLPVDTSFIRNNVFYGMRQGRIEHGVLFLGSNLKWRVENNIFIHIDAGIDLEGAGKPPLKMSNNLFFNNRINYNGIGALPGTQADPMVFNDSTNDFHIVLGSPAIGQSINWGQTRDFYNRNINGNKWAIGAIEYDDRFKIQGVLKYNSHINTK
jgi:hypothetical protein